VTFWLGLGSGLDLDLGSGLGSGLGSFWAWEGGFVGIDEAKHAPQD